MFFKLGDRELQHPKIDVLRLWPVDVGGEMENIVYGALKQAGFLIQQYENSYNQYENTSGLSYEEYFENRSSNHRYNVRRRQRNLEKVGKLEFCFIQMGRKKIFIENAWMAIFFLRWKAGSLLDP